MMYSPVPNYSGVMVGVWGGGVNVVFNSFITLVLSALLRYYDVHYYSGR